MIPKRGKRFAPQPGLQLGERSSMGLEFNVELLLQHQSQAKNEYGLPRKSRLRAFALRRPVGSNKTSTACPLPQLVGRQSGQRLSFAGTDKSHFVTLGWVVCRFVHEKGIMPIVIRKAGGSDRSDINERNQNLAAVELFVRFWGRPRINLAVRDVRFRSHNWSVSVFRSHEALAVIGRCFSRFLSTAASPMLLPLKPMRREFQGAAVLRHCPHHVVWCTIWHLSLDLQRHLHR